MEWKWSINESYEKSRRRPQLQENANTNINTETSAFYQALLSENDSWTINEIPIGLETKMELNKRENVYNKMGKILLVAFAIIACIVAILLLRKNSVSETPTPTLSDAARRSIFTIPPVPTTPPTPYDATRAYALLTFSPTIDSITPSMMDSVLAKKADPAILKKAGLSSLSMATLECYVFFTNTFNGMTGSIEEQDLLSVWFLSILKELNPSLYRKCRYIDSNVSYKIIFIPGEFFDEVQTYWTQRYYPIPQRSIFFLRNYGIQPGLNDDSIDTTVVQTLDDFVKRVSTYLFFNLGMLMRRDSYEKWKLSCK